MTSHELSALTGAYAVDALDEQERARFEAHLATCPDCAAEVRGLRAAAAELSQTTVTAPPPALRGDVLTAISQVRPLPPAGDTVRDLRRRRPARWVWPSVAAACALIAVVAAVWGYQQHRDADQRRAQAAAITKVLDSPDAATVTGTVGSSGHATLVYSKAERRLVLVGNHIAPPPDGKTYQLWMIDPNGRATSAGLFRPGSNGNILVQAKGILPDTAHMGISIERHGGAPKPTPSAIVALMAI